jgi:hypothetical protein
LPKPLVARGLDEPLERGLVAAAVEHVARRRGVGKVLRPHQIAAPYLGGVEPEIARDEIDHALGHGGGDRMAHGAVLRGDDLVLRHDAQRCLVGAHAIGPREQTEDLAALDDARARIRGVGPHRGGDAGPHRGQDAVAVGRHLDAERLLARVDIGQERLASARNELDGPPERQRERADGHVILVDVDLDAEAAADVGGDDPDARLAQREELREDGLHHVRDLGRDPHRERACRGLVVGDQAARLERHAGVAARGERARPHAARAGECALDVAGREARLGEGVVAELGMDQWRAGGQPRLRGKHRGQRLVLDLDQRRRVVGGSPALGGHRDDRLADVAHALDGEGEHRAALHPGVVPEDAAVGFAEPGDGVASQHAGDARRSARALEVDAYEARVGVRAADEGGVHHARQRHVVDVAAAPGQ